MNFFKMESNSSDYIIVNNLEKNYKNYIRNIKELCDRNTGIGSNGIIFIEESKYDNACIKLDVYNSDGSKPNLNINAIFCACEYLKNIIKNKKYNIEINNQIISVSKENNCFSINNLKYDLNPKKVPILTEKNIFFNELLMVDNKFYEVSSVTVGNPHVIVNMDNLYSVNVSELGEKIRFQNIFPEKINVVFSKKINENIYIKIYESGNGKVESCGTAAAASLVNSFYNSHVLVNKEYKIYQDGGVSLVTLDNNDKIKIKGKAKYLFKGKI